MILLTNIDGTYPIAQQRDLIFKQPTVEERIVVSKLFSQIILNTSIVGLSSTMIGI